MGESGINPLSHSANNTLVGRIRRGLQKTGANQRRVGMFYYACVGVVYSSSERWFGLFLLPIVSWSADGAVSALFFFDYLWRLFRGQDPPPPATLAKARAIDLSIQFNLFWMSFLVLLAWWTDKTLNLLFGTPHSHSHSHSL